MFNLQNSGDVILSFADKQTEKLFYGRRSKLPPKIRERAAVKLAALAAATELETLRIPPSNRLEVLKGDRAGQYSIRINRQCASVSAGKTGMRMTSKSPITTDTR